MKIALFTDIHWGAKNNSAQHNQDCLDFVSWFIENVEKNDCKMIVFMGDWFEQRNAINVATLNASFDGLRRLDSLGIPIYFCVGNHDLFHRASRDQFSTYHFSEFKNVILINEPLFHGDLAFFPYLFKDEYPSAAALIKKHGPRYVFGHFEFRNFVVTGSDRRMEHGPDHHQFDGPTYVFSGHFHKRQVMDNVIYIGSAFPTNYGDAWDDERGMCVLNTENDDVEFIDWLDCPKYRKMRLSSLLSDSTMVFPPKCRVRCLIDVDISYSDAQALKNEMIKQLGLREFSLEENLVERDGAITGEDVLENFDLSSLNEAVIKLLRTGVSGTSTINAERLVEIYQRL